MKHVDQARYAGHTTKPWKWWVDGHQSGGAPARTDQPREWDGTENDLSVDRLVGAEQATVCDGVWHNDDTAGISAASVANALLIADAPQLLADLIECEKQRDAAVAACNKAYAALADAAGAFRTLDKVDQSVRWEELRDQCDKAFISVSDALKLCEPALCNPPSSEPSP